MTDHHRHREALGAYVLGALSPGERADVDGHLSGCVDCREELASLAVLPGLLGRLEPDEVDVAALTLPDTAAIGAVADLRRRERRRLRVWKSVAAAALLALFALAAVVVLPVPRGGGDLYVVHPVATDAQSVTGEAVVEDRDWGMVVELDLRTLPERRGFVLWAAGTEDRRVRAASWRAGEDGAIRLIGSCYLDPAEVIRLEVTTPDDELLLTLERRDEGLRH